MTLSRMGAVAALAVATVACGAREHVSGSGGSWIGTMTAEGSVTTVINEAGSVWGGTATLVEEASIGVDSGSEPYLLGDVRGFAASQADGRIYLIDAQIPALRAYDWAGRHVADFGRDGEGPGEYRNPVALGVDGAQRVWLHDRRGVLLVFSPEGEPLATIAIGGQRVGGPQGMVVTPEGTAYVLGTAAGDAAATAAAGFAMGMVPYGIDGAAGELVELPEFEGDAYLTAAGPNLMRFIAVPFFAYADSVLTAQGAILSAEAGAYRFRLDRADGSAMVVERAWEPVAVQPAEAAAHRAGVTAYLREVDPGWVWAGAPIPEVKPPFNRLLATLTGEVWALRSGHASLRPACDPAVLAPDVNDAAPCWDERRIVDAFAADGRYLGEIDVHEDMSFDPPPFVYRDTVIARAENDAGIVMLKRYRLVPPGEAASATASPIGEVGG